MTNGNDFSMGDFTPSWMDSGGIFDNPAYPPFGEDDSDWDTNCETTGGEPGDDYQPPC